MDEKQSERLIKAVQRCARALEHLFDLLDTSFRESKEADEEALHALNKIQEEQMFNRYEEEI